MFSVLDSWASGKVDSSCGGLQLPGFGGGSLMAAGCRDVGISDFFFELAVELWLEEEYDLCTYYPRGYISWVLGMVRIFHSPGGCGHFCPVDMMTGLRSFWALGWCMYGADLGRERGRGAVAIWGCAEQSKKIIV